jgi:L-fuconate dehydratase
MKEHRIISLETRDARFPLHAGAGSDAVHSGSEYAFARTLLSSSGGLYGTGIALTLGQGNQLVCEAIELLGKGLQGAGNRRTDGGLRRRCAAAGTAPAAALAGTAKGCNSSCARFSYNACFDLWAKARGVPLWRLLLDLSLGNS